MFNLLSPMLAYNRNLNMFMASYYSLNANPFIMYPQINFSGIMSLPSVFNNYNYNSYFCNPFSYFNNGFYQMNYYPNNTSIWGNDYTNMHNYHYKADTEPKDKSVTKNEEKTVPDNIITETESKAINDNFEDKNISNEFINTAHKYSNVKEADNSHLKFCINSGCAPINYGEWCTDFVTYVVKETYNDKGKNIPYGFGTHDVEELKNWAINSPDSNVKFIRTSNQTQKAKFIKNNIKPGDIFILNENGASHTGFVSQIYDDGSFKTIEGNRNDMVCSYNYSPDYDKLSGFIRLS